MNSVQTLGKWFYIGLIMLQIIFIALKLSGFSVFGYDLSKWCWLWVLFPIIAYVGIKLLSHLGEALSNLINYLLGVAVVVIIIGVVVYLILL